MFLSLLLSSFPSSRAGSGSVTGSGSGASRTPTIEVTARNSLQFWDEVSRQKLVFLSHWPLIFTLVILFLFPIFFFYRRYQRHSADQRCIWYFTAAENYSKSSASQNSLISSINYYDRAIDLADPGFPSFTQPEDFNEFIVRCKARKARILDELGNPDAAIELYRETIKSKEFRSELLNAALRASLFHQLGLALNKIAEIPEAIKAFHQARRIDPHMQYIASVGEQRLVDSLINTNMTVKPALKKPEESKNNNSTPQTQPKEKEKLTDQQQTSALSQNQSESQPQPQSPSRPPSSLVDDKHESKKRASEKSGGKQSKKE